MIALFLLLLLLGSLYRGAAVLGVRNITILNQSNAIERYPNLLNRIMCQNLTDRLYVPLVQGADDAVIPPLSFFQSQGVVNGVQDCSAITFRFDAVRTKRDLPTSQQNTPITIQFMRNSEQNTPGVVFYSKTLLWPTNDYMWLQSYLSVPWSYQITLQLNELGDDMVTRFNFRDFSFLPPGATFWISWYFNAPLHPGQSSRVNAMYWSTLTTVAGSSPLQASLYGLVNQNFSFQDPMNFVGKGFVNWTTAPIVEAAFFIPPVTNNLAFSLFFTCNVATPPLTPPPPTEEPTEYLTTTSPVGAAPQRNTSWLNATYGLWGEDAHWYVAVFLPIGVGLLCLMGIVFIVAWRHRRLQRKRAQASPQPKRQPIVRVIPEEPRPGRNPLFTQPIVNYQDNRIPSDSILRSQLLNNEVYSTTDNEI